MKKQNLISGLLGCAAIVNASFTMTLPAYAGSKLFAAFGDYPIYMNGSSSTNQNGDVDPFVIELFSAGNECMRIEVSTQTADLEATLVAPNGTVWRDDDGGGLLRPLIKAVTPQRGWYILRVSHYAGASVDADFRFNVFRKAPNDAACATPTPPAAGSVSVRAMLKPAAAPGTFQMPARGR